MSGLHRRPSRAGRRIAVALGLAAAMVAGAGAYAAASSTRTPTCVDGSLAEDVPYSLCVTLPEATTVTVPVPTLVPTTVTETVTQPVPTTVTSTVTSTVTPSSSPTATPTATTSPTPTPTPPGAGAWPTAATTGVPAGWVPRETRSSWRITSPGVYEDVRVNGKITVAARGVTLRNVEVVGGVVENQVCGGGISLTLENVTFRPPAGQARAGEANGAIYHGNFIARNVKVLDYIEGLRAGSCGPVEVYDSYLTINDGNDCQLHADGIQGYGGRGITVRNTVIDARKMTCGTAPFFYPRNQDNRAPVDIDRLWLAGGGRSFRLGVGPATARGVQILDRSWGYGPVDVYCPAVTVWDVSIVDASGRVVRKQDCAGDGT